jgi:hypothetical protein
MLEAGTPDGTERGMATVDTRAGAATTQASCPHRSTTVGTLVPLNPRRLGWCLGRHLRHQPMTHEGGGLVNASRESCGQGAGHVARRQSLGQPGVDQRCKARRLARCEVKARLVPSETGEEGEGSRRLFSLPPCRVAAWGPVVGAVEGREGIF